MSQNTLILAVAKLGLTRTATKRLEGARYLKGLFRRTTILDFYSRHGSITRKSLTFSSLASCICVETVQTATNANFWYVRLI